MSKYFVFFDDFSTYTVDTNTPGVTVRSGTPSYAPASGSETVLAYKDEYHALKNGTSGAQNVISFNALDADANRANFDYVVSFSKDLCTAEVCYLYGRGNAFTDYYRLRLTMAGGVQIDKVVASAATDNINAAGIAYTWAAGKSYFVRFRGNGTTLQVRIWDAALGMAGEPTTWNITTTDASITAAGWIGAGLFHSTLLNRVFPVNFHSFGTNGDTAPCPRTNAEYLAWCARGDVNRAVLAEFGPTGYNSAASPYTASRKVFVSNFGYTSKPWDTPANKHYDAWLTTPPTISREMPLSLSGQASTRIGEAVISNPATQVKGTAYLLLDGASGCYASTPDSAANSITGDIDLRADVALDDWTPAAQVTIFGKYVQSGNQRAFAFCVASTGALILYTTPDGLIGSVIDGTSTAAVGIADGTRKWIRATLDVNDGAGNRVYKFYTSPDGVTWTQLGATVTTAGVTTIFDSTAIVGIGGIDAGASQNPAGKIYRAQLLNGIDGTLAVDFNLGNVRKGATTIATPTGEEWTVNGTAKIRQVDDSFPGVRDLWHRMRWQRNYYAQWLGDPSWPKHDFRLVVYGRLGTPTQADLRSIRFPIADISDFLAKRVVSTRISSGDYANQYKPKLIGFARCIEPPGDRATLVYQITDGAIDTSANGRRRDSVYDYNGSAMTHIGTAVDTLTVSAVDTGTETITASAPHNLLAGYRVMFAEFSSPPSPLVANVNYYVIAAGLTTTQFRLSATRGGAAINLTAATTGAAFTGYGYEFDTTNGTLTLYTQPTRVLVFNLSQGGLDPSAGPATLIENVAFTACGMSLNFRDATIFDAAKNADLSQSAVVGLWYGPGAAPTAKEVIERVCLGSRSWYAVSPRGKLQTGWLGLPAATAVRSFTESDLVDGMIRPIDMIRPVDRSKTADIVAPWFLSGPNPIAPLWVGGTYVTGTPAEAAQGKTYVPATNYGAASIPLDEFPNNTDSNDVADTDSLLNDSASFATRIAGPTKYQLGVFEFVTNLSAMSLNIGDTISVTCNRYGFKQYTASDPASPDNTAAFDARLCVVIALIDADMVAGTVRVRVYRRVLGYYPTADIN